MRADRKIAHLRASLRSELGARAVNAAFWSVSGAIASRVLGLLSSIVIARLLGKAGFGEYGIIQGTFSMFSVFAGFGLGLTATKYVAELRVRDRERTGRILGLSETMAASVGAVVAILLIVLSPWLASRSLAAPHLSRPLQISALSILLGAVDGALTGALVGFEAFRAIARVNLISGLLSFAASLIGVYAGGLEGLIWGMNVGMLLMCALDHQAVRVEAKRAGISISYRGFRSELPVLWSFSVPAMMGSIVVVPVNWFCSAYLVNLPHGYSEMGVYNAALQWRTAILFVPMRVAAIALPILASSIGTGHVHRLSRLLWYNVVLVTSTALIPALAVAALAPQIMMFYGRGFVPSASVLSVLAISAVPMVVNQTMGAAVASLDRMWYGFLANSVWAVAIIIGTLLWVPAFGALGAAFAALAAVPFQTLCLTLFCVRNTGRQSAA